MESQRGDLSIPPAHMEAFRRFLAGCRPGDRIAIVHDSDADGVSAGVVLERALERANFTDVHRIIPDRFRDAWAVTNRARIEAARPDVLLVLDLGVRDEPLATNARTCFVDHHHPDGDAPHATVISGYDLDPIRNTSLMVFDLCSSIADVSDLDWISVLGVVSDLGDKAPFPILARAKEKYGMRDIRELATLINASRRASMYDPEAAARLLLEHQSPRSALTFGSAELARLQSAREEVRVELAKGKKAAPKFSGEVALVRVASPCQIHPLIAQIWRSRLPNHYVLVANEAYLPGRVNFAARSSGARNVLQFLRSIDLDAGNGSYARGHDQASGGSLPVDAWNDLLAKLGFGEDVFASGIPPAEIE